VAGGGFGFPVALVMYKVGIFSEDSFALTLVG